MKPLHHVALVILFLGINLTLSSHFSVFAAPAEDDYGFEITRRLNAHGNEFMSLALTRDSRRLIIGTESGKLLVWGISEGRILKELDQASPVHCVVGLSDPDVFIAAGGPHTNQIRFGVVRKWRISSGQSEDWPVPHVETILSLAIDPKTDVVATGTASGHISVWNAMDGRVLARRRVEGAIMGIAVKGPEVWLTKLQLAGKESESNAVEHIKLDRPAQTPAKLTRDDEGKAWSDLALSPDCQVLAAHFESENVNGIALIDPTTGKQLASFEAVSCAWSSNGELILFDHEVATGRVTMNSAGQTSRSDLLKGATFHGAGSPSNMTGHVVAPDGSQVWQVFQLGATLVESNLNSKSFEVLYSLPGYLYAMEADDHLGLIATGGDDKFVRVRKLSDLSLVKEFRVEAGVPQGVALLDDGTHIIFSASSKDSPTRITIGDLVSGEMRVVFEIPEPFVRVNSAPGGFIYSRGGHMFLANANGATIREFIIEGKLDGYGVSENGQWIVAANDKGQLFSIEVKTGTTTRVGAETIDSLTALTITNDGRYIYTTEFQASLRKWDVKTNAMQELASIRGQARTLRLSHNEREILVGGNHRDVAIYEIATGERRFYLQVGASDFYITNVWLGGDRLLFSTDAGILFDGMVQR